jgi:hypothetical protein
MPADPEDALELAAAKAAAAELRQLLDEGEAKAKEAFREVLAADTKSMTPTEHSRWFAAFERGRKVLLALAKHRDEQAANADWRMTVDDLYGDLATSGAPPLSTAERAELFDTIPPAVLQRVMQLGGKTAPGKLHRQLDRYLARAKPAGRTDNPIPAQPPPRS